ncbi:MAG: TVP38/TMEM64 family protein [Candidatus Pacebacteria bacterium]|jgi:uncharacterized membrane protein YdjX (TVP38/TMEM64 family)|nr:TVP38/TMEM64 family protein [Candidatus Paceibacterota bacterium]
MNRLTIIRVLGGLVLLVAVVVAAEFSGLRDFVTSGALKVLIEESGPLAPLLFMFIYAVATIVFIPGTPLTVLGGALFGPLLGTVYVVFGATIGALGAFLLARYFGGRLISESTGRVVERLREYDERLFKKGFVTVLILRLIPLFPFNGLNFGLGLTRLQTRVYLLGTFVGIIPGTFAYVYFGASLASLNPLHVAIAIIGLIIISMVGKFLLTKTNHNIHAK